jgi:hypothetical protein
MCRSPQWWRSASWWWPCCKSAARSLPVRRGTQGKGTIRIIHQHGHLMVPYYQGIPHQPLIRFYRWRPVWLKSEGQTDVGSSCGCRTLIRNCRSTAASADTLIASGSTVCCHHHSLQPRITYGTDTASIDGCRNSLRQPIRPCRSRNIGNEFWE